MTEPRLPDFLIVGAPRCGTSALNHYLSQHPAVFMSPRKEPRYFTENLDRGPAWYSQFFAGAPAEQIAGEASPDYLFRGAGEQIVQLVPEVKAVALLRDPVARAWSHYWMRRSRDLEDRPFEQIVEEELAGATELYVTPGRYAEQLDALATWIPRDAIHVELFESLRDSPAETYQRVCRFLSVSDSDIPSDIGRVVNPQLAFRSTWMRRRARSFPRVARKTIARLNAKSFEPPTIDPAIAARLREHYAPGNSALAATWIDPAGVWES